MRAKATGGQTWPLTSPLDNPTFLPGGAIRFDMNDVPDRCPTGPLAYYIPAILLFIAGVLVPPVDDPFGTAIPWWDIPRLLIKDVEVNNAWHGTPLSSSYVLGEHLRTIEFLGGGFRYGNEWSPEASGTDPVPFELLLRLPLSASYGDLVAETSQLALLYQPASLYVNFKPATALDAFSTGATWTSLQARASAELDPRQEIVLGTGVEWVLHRQVSSAQGSEVQIKGFGRNSKLSGVEEKGGVMALMELTNIAGQGGALVDPHDIKEFAWDWRGQKNTKDIASYFQQIRQQLPNTPPFIAVPGTVSPSDRMNWPFYNNQTTGADQYRSVPSNLLAWIIALAGDRLSLTDLETASRDETYHLDPGATGFNPANEHLILGHYAKQWTDGKRGDFTSQVTKGDQSSLAAYVLGPKWSTASLSPRGIIGKHTVTGDQTAYIPWQFKAAA